MSKPNALIIDDEYETRCDVYSDILSKHFEIHYFSQEEMFLHRDRSKHYDMLVIDNILEDWKITHTLISFLEKYPELTQDGTPVVAVSKYWLDNQGQSLWDISDTIRKYPIIMIVAWEDFGNFPKGSDLSVKWKKSIESNIYLKYLWHCGKQPALPKEDDSITILQLSDPQFGAETDHSSYMDRFKISENLRNNVIRPDLVIFCGDMTQSGKAVEFEQADKWIREFADTLEPKVPTDRFVFTIGNHDCDFDVFSTMMYKYDFSKNVFGKRPGGKHWEIQDNSYISNDEYTFANYLLFERRLTSNNVSAVYRTSRLNTVNDSFTNWGIRIITLNSMAEISPDDHLGKGVSKEDLEQISSYCLNEHRYDNIYTILVSHYSPYDLGFESSDGKMQNLWARLESFVIQLDVNLWLCGHSHGASDQIIKIADGKVFRYSKSSSFRLPSKDLAPGAQQSYNVITLKRNKGIVTETEILKTTL